MSRFFVETNQESIQVYEHVKQELQQNNKTIRIKLYKVNPCNTLTAVGVKASPTKNGSGFAPLKKSL